MSIELIVYLTGLVLIPCVIAYRYGCLQRIVDKPLPEQVSDRFYVLKRPKVPRFEGSTLWEEYDIAYAQWEKDQARYDNAQSARRQAKIAQIDLTNFSGLILLGTLLWPAVMGVVLIAGAVYLPVRGAMWLGQRIGCGKD